MSLFAGVIIALAFLGCSNGVENDNKLTVKANAFSESAKEKIEAIGGTAEVI